MPKKFRSQSSWLAGQSREIRRPFSPDIVLALPGGPLPSAHQSDLERFHERGCRNGAANAELLQSLSPRNFALGVQRHDYPKRSLDAERIDAFSAGAWLV